MISVNSTAINMTKFPEQSVEEGSVAQYACETNYAHCTDSSAILWFVGDTSMNATDVHIKVNYSSWTYKEMTKSTMTVTTDRKFNNKQVKCVLGNDDKIFNEHNLNVTCKYILPHL